MSENDTNIFTQPLALAKLARFIAKAYAAQGTWKGKKGAKPLVSTVNSIYYLHCFFLFSLASFDASGFSVRCAVGWNLMGF